METVPFSLIVALGNVVLAVMVVAFVAAGAYAWAHRGKEYGENEMTAGDLWLGVVFLLSLVSVPVVCGIHAENTERHALNSSDYTSYGVYEATVERVTLTDYTVRTDYGAVLTAPTVWGGLTGAWTRVIALRWMCRGCTSMRIRALSGGAATIWV